MLDGSRVRYVDLWQRRNLLLVTLRAGDPTGADYATGLARYGQAFTAHDAVTVVTHDVVPGLPAPGILAADRWGTIYEVAAATRAVDLPGMDTVAEWLRYIDYECPECQGEVR
jgi:hypothetical protein